MELLKGIDVSKLKRSSVVLIALVGLLAVSTVAVAEHEETHDEDTLFSFGYDETNHVVAINLGPNDTLYECDLQNGPLSATYGEADSDQNIPIDLLEDLDGVKVFDPRLQDELAEGLTEASDPVEYSGADGECGVAGVVVAGPNGQINHGQFMKAAKSLFDVEGQGCIVRYLAKSDIGKTDSTKLATSDVDPLFEIGETGDITFATFEADCSRGAKAGKLNAQSEEKSQRRSDSPGKSADAPGKNK